MTIVILRVFRFARSMFPTADRRSLFLFWVEFSSNISSETIERNKMTQNTKVFWPSKYFSSFDMDVASSNVA